MMDAGSKMFLTVLVFTFSQNQENLKLITKIFLLPR